MPTTQTGVTITMIANRGFGASLFSDSNNRTAVSGDFFTDGASITWAGVSVFGSSSIITTGRIEVTEPNNWWTKLIDPANFHIILGAPLNAEGNPRFEETCLLHPVNARSTVLSAESVAQFETFWTAIVDEGNLVGDRIAFQATISDESLVEPVGILDSAGTPDATFVLRAPRMGASDRSGVPASRALLSRPLQIPRAKGLGGEPDALTNLPPPTMSMLNRSEVPWATADLKSGLRLANRYTAPAPFARMALPPPTMSMSRSTGAPVVDTKLFIGPVRIEYSAPVAIDIVNLARPTLVTPMKGTSGVPVVRTDMQLPLNIPLMKGATRLPVALFNMRPARMARTASAGTPDATTDMLFPNLRINPISAGVPASQLSIAGGVNEPQFRYVPDYVAFRRQEADIELPRVYNEVPAGRYTVSGLPDGMTYDADDHKLIGTPTGDPGDYTVTIRYDG